MSRLSGHSLWSEGWPVVAAPDSKNGWRPMSRRSDVGHGLCSCGQLSPPLLSLADRKRWHREHKDQIRASAA